MHNSTPGGRTTKTTNGVGHIAPSSQPVLLLTPQQAAKALAISPRKLWSMTASGEVPHVRLGRCVRYPVDGLRHMIDRKRKGGEAR